MTKQNTWQNEDEKVKKLTIHPKPQKEIHFISDFLLATQCSLTNPSCIHTRLQAFPFKLWQKYSITQVCKLRIWGKAIHEMSDISSDTSSSLRSSTEAGGMVTEELICNNCEIPLAKEEKEAHRQWHKAQRVQGLTLPRGPTPRPMGVPIQHPKTASPRPRCHRPPLKKDVASPRPSVKRSKTAKERNDLPSPSSRPRTRAAAASGKAD